MPDYIVPWGLGQAFRPLVLLRAFRFTASFAELWGLGLLRMDLAGTDLWGETEVPGDDFCGCIWSLGERSRNSLVTLLHGSH